ncbi:pyridoxamine 5'-phosphate oxidase family protein [Campylobacter ureolyticus]|uniref:pyridoxamine 5'-phosphate oxidase family protein n=1 Tax=Campylobacter ureolyticus TaxID=827 RepID=UPI0022B595A0|nr:pyridoxamine 5'-phosphate oxidase family protein [Campylobacter ureolyticus]MCZ6174882.1 pyridoxamine 5'-phosphate oxidase family protein [Campylobacter ureolyticus]
MRRVDRKLSDEKVCEIVDKCEYGTFSTIDGDEIFSIPLSLVRDGNFIYIHGAVAGSKKRLFGDGKEVTIVCVSYAKVPNLSDEELNKFMQNPKSLGSNVFTTEFKSAILKTLAYEVLDTTEKVRALRLLCEKYTPKYMKAFDLAVSASLERTNIYKFEIISMSAKAKILKQI